MKQYRKWTAWLGAGAVVIALGAGCTDQNNNAVPDTAGNVAMGAANTTENVVGAMGNVAGNVADSNGVDAMGNVAGNMAGGMDNMATAAGNVATATGNVASNAAGAVGNGVAATGSALGNLADAATLTPKIKTALGANAAMRGSNINVDTLGSKDTIALRGTVTSAAQKTLAESIAKKNAPGYKIANQLTMGGKM